MLYAVGVYKKDRTIEKVKMFKFIGWKEYVVTVEKVIQCIK